MVAIIHFPDSDAAKPFKIEEIILYPDRISAVLLGAAGARQAMRVRIASKANVMTVIA